MTNKPKPPPPPKDTGKSPKEMTQDDKDLVKSPLPPPPPQQD